MSYRIKDLNLTKFKNIEDLYAYIDENSDKLICDLDLTNLLVDYRGFTESVHEKHLTQRELECQMFFGNGDINQEFYFYNNDQDIEFRNLITDEYDYLKKRIQNTTNSILLGRYNHLLWKLNTKIRKREFALEAINYYFKSVSRLYESYKIDNNENSFSRIENLYSMLVLLCNDVNEHIPEIKNLTNFLLFDTTDLKFYMKFQIIKEMLKYNKIFKAEAFKNVLSIFEEELLNSKDSLTLVEFYLPTAIKICQKIGCDVKRWHNEMGNLYFNWAESETEKDRFWIKLDTYKKAIDAFTYAGNGEMKTKVEQLYSELKPSVKLTSYRFEMNSKTHKEFFEMLKNIVEEILENEPFTIYSTIAHGHLFPKKSIILENLKDSKNDFMKHCAVVRFDDNKNIVNSNPKEEEDYELYSAYIPHLTMNTLQILQKVFVFGIKSGHLSSDNFISFLEKETWMGINYTKKTDLSGESITINWLSLLKPSIIEFFTQMQKWISQEDYIPNFILCTDSLILKIEGLLRNFCERANSGVSKGNPKKGMQEGLMNDVLENEAIKKYFSEDDILFFNVLFDSKGMNLRNKIAHSFLSENEYNYSTILLVITALLRVGKFNHKIKEPTDF